MVHEISIAIAIASAGVQTIAEHDPGGSLVAAALVVVLALVRRQRRVDARGCQWRWSRHLTILTRGRMFLPVKQSGAINLF